MAYYASTLIERSWYLSGIVSRGLQGPTGQQMSDGLYLLNALLDFKQIETDLIPYYQYIELAATPDTEYYFLPYVADIESMTFNLSVVRYPMESVTRTNYFGSARVDNIFTLPFSYNYNRAVGGGNLSLYFVPDQNYPLKMMAKIFLVDVSLTTDLTDVSETVPYTFINSATQGYDTSYIEYLRYSLSQMMCSEYGVEFNPESKAMLQKYQRKLMYMSAPDLSMHKSSTLTSNRAGVLNWGFINLGRGWTP